MTPGVAKKLKASSRDFLRVVWPAIAKQMGGGKIYPVESVTQSGFAKELDVLAGIDVWHVIENEGMRGIASRVQWPKDGYPPFDTFSVRLSVSSGQPTEFQKRLNAIRNRDRGYLLPEFTVQAYVAKPAGEGQLLSAAVVKTSSLISLLNTILLDFEDARQDEDWGLNQPWGGDETFIWVKWDYMRRKKMPIRIFHNTPNNIGSWMDGRQPLVSHVYRLS